MQHVLILLVLFFFTMTSPASAQTDAGHAYAGAGISMAFEEFNLPRGIDADHTGALDLIAGYRMNEIVALEGEIQLLYLPGFDLDGVGGDIDGVAFSGNAKLFPMQSAGEVDPFVLIGGGLLDFDGPHRIDANETNWMYQIGGGVDVEVADRTLVELKATYRFPQGALSSYDYWTLGANLQYRF
jgi:hypothetical protein